MGLSQLDFEGKNKVEVALDSIRTYEPVDGYYLGFSGGKDSVVIYDLAMRSGVKFDAHYNVSPIDPPEIYSFIKTYHPLVSWDKLARNFWKRMMTEAPPMRTSRWCCEVIKEAGGIGRVKLLGMRRKESVSRKDYCIIQKHRKYPNTSWMLPLVDWDNNEVWEYIKLRDLSYCPLYDEGYARLGCVLCPFESASVTKKNIVRFPKITHAWRRAFDRYFQIRIDRGTPLQWETAQDFWEWWISRK